MGSYLGALRYWRFALLWSGLTVSAFGDGLTRFSLIWLTYHLRGSAADVGILITAYSLPVLIGGPLGGLMPDRLGPRRAMLADSMIRGAVVGMVPVLFHLGALQPWHLYAVAATHGLMRMVTLAGAPTLVPAILPVAHLNAANALEMISYSISSTAGLPIAGLLLAVMHGADVLILDALSYAVLAGCLAAIGPVVHRGHRQAQRSGLGPVVQFALSSPFVRNSTFMYMLHNVGRGVLDVLVPVVLMKMPGADSRTLGLATAGAAAGQLAGSLLSGAINWRISYPRLIAWSLSLGGLPLVTAALPVPWAWLALALAASSAVHAPLTVWAQTVRMQLIPEGLRGRVFSILRTVMQTGPALGGVIGGRVVEALPGPMVIGLVLVLTSGPGLVALLAPRVLATDPQGYRRTTRVTRKIPQGGSRATDVWKGDGDDDGKGNHSGAS